jgi:hypothetical protein
MWKYWSSYMKLCVEKCLKFGQQLDSPPWSSQGTLCPAVSGPRINYWNGTPTLFSWFGSEWLLAVPINKVCLKWTKISGYWRHKKKKIVRMALKPILWVPNRFPTVAATLG